MRLVDGFYWIKNYRTFFSIEEYCSCAANKIMSLIDKIQEIISKNMKKYYFILVDLYQNVKF